MSQSYISFSLNGVYLGVNKRTYNDKTYYNLKILTDDDDSYDIGISIDQYAEAVQYRKLKYTISIPFVTARARSSNSGAYLSLSVPEDVKFSFFELPADSDFSDIGV